MDPLRELLAVDHRQALEFFVLRLQYVSEPTVDRQELLYNASLLAHYAQVSTQPDVDLPTPAKNDLTPYQFGWVNGTRRDEQAFCCPFCLDGVGAHRLRRHNRMAVVSTQHN